VYHPGIGTLPEAVAPNLRNRGFHVVAEIDRADGASADGVVVAHGGPQGGYAIYVKGNRLHYVHNLLGAAVMTVSASVELPNGATSARVVFTPTGRFAGDVALYYGDVPVGEGHIARTTPISFGVEGFSVGYQRGAAITEAYDAPFAIDHAVLTRVVIDGLGPAYQDRPAEERAALAQQ
jgi:hypothetical protein